MGKTANVFGGLPPVLSGELFETLASCGDTRVERIISLGHCCADDEWFDQDWDEWVLLLAGGAMLLLEGDDEPLSLKAGDHLLIPAYRRHRVIWTDPEVHTVWVAVHFAADRNLPMRSQTT